LPQPTIFRRSPGQATRQLSTATGPTPGPRQFLGPQADALAQGYLGDLTRRLLQSGRTLATLSAEEII
jgi:hypothetical protein